MKKAIQAYPWSLESLLKWRTKSVFSPIIIIMKWMKCTLNPLQHSQSLHDCPFPLSDPKIRYVQLVSCRTTVKVSIFSYHEWTYCASIRTNYSNRANNSSSALVNNIRRKHINPQFQHCTSLHHITGVVTMVPCGPFGPRMPFGPKSPGGPWKRVNNLDSSHTYNISSIHSSISTMCLPLVQKLPEFLEILVPLYHPMPEFNKKWEKQNSLKNHLNYDIIFFCVKLACVRHSRVVLLALRLLVAPAVPFHLWTLFSPEVHSGHGAHVHPEWRQEDWNTWNTKTHISKTIRQHLATVTDPQVIGHFCCLTGYLHFAFTFGPMLPCSPGSPGMPILPRDPVLPGSPVSPSSPCSPWMPMINTLQMY